MYGGGRVENTKRNERRRNGIEKEEGMNSFEFITYDVLSLTDSPRDTGVTRLRVIFNDSMNG